MISFNFSLLNEESKLDFQFFVHLPFFLGTAVPAANCPNIRGMLLRKMRKSVKLRMLINQKEEMGKISN